MTFLKSITLFLAVAIANPMCCCLSFAKTDIESLPEEASASPHACCKAGGETSSPKNASPAGDHDCYHEELGASQINDAANGSLSSSIVSVPLSIEYLGATSSYTPSQACLLSDSQLPSALTRHFPGTSYSQVYCVFIL